MTRVVQDIYHDSRSQQLVYLVVTTYGGEHLYGTLRWYDPTDELGRNVGRIDVEAVLTPYATRRMNRTDASYRYKVGEDCGRFLDVRDVRIAGLAMFREKFNTDTHVLIVQDVGCLDPCEVLSGPEPWRTEINEIFREFEKGGGWDCSISRAREITTRYETKMMEVIPEKVE